MTRLVVVLGVLSLALFVSLWPPGGALLAGVGLLLLAAVRADNHRKGMRR